MVVLLSRSLCAMTRRIPERGIDWSARTGGVGRSPRFEPPLPPAGALRTSFFTIRPPGPLPVTRRRSIPFSSANLRASGEAFTRSPWGGEAAGVVFAGVTAGVAGFSSAETSGCAFGVLVSLFVSVVGPPADGALSASEGGSSPSVRIKARAVPRVTTYPSFT